jgi:D-sedoheptulose 7-phosphate isomerase
MSDSKTFAAQYLENLTETLRKIDPQAVAAAIDCLREARDADKTIYACGNGGSALIASQMVVDIVKGASYGHKKRFKMIGLTDAIGTILAYANDVSYDVVFEEQLKNFAVAGDVLIAISGSGNSPNVIKAVEYANSIGCRTIGLTTSESGKLRSLANLPLVVPSNHMGRLEDIFFALTHILCYAFIEEPK